MKKRKHILFVCTEARQRSPTAADLVNTSPHYKSYEAKAAGISWLATTRVNEELINWADIIIVMNENQDKHKTYLLDKFPFLKHSNKPIYDFDIPDCYFRDEPELREIVKRKIKKYVKETDKS